jgi:hypothetical protein
MGGDDEGEVKRGSERDVKMVKVEKDDLTTWCSTGASSFV